MDDVTLIRVVSGISFSVLLVILFVRAIKKQSKDRSGETEVKPGWSSQDRNYTYGGCFFCLVVGVTTHWASVEGIVFGIGYAMGTAGIAFAISYVAYGRRENWRKFARLFFWLCLILSALPYYPLHSGTK